ncbi:MAG: LysR family transcriptional regulator, partial [Clostridiales bacterium]|nr:LysR family transcriptional regulator [Clostridiales bacterium]
MDTKSLKFFLAVAEHRNFTKASEQLYITQSALSHHIAELEAELNTKLFLRTTRSVSLTPSGEILYRSAKDLISRFDQIALDIRKADSGAS